MVSGWRTEEPLAFVAGRWLTDLREVTSDVAALERPGWWVVVGTYEGSWTCARFAAVSDEPPSERARSGWPGVPTTSWASSLSLDAYVAAVEEVQRRIATGEVYQVNVCRVLSAPLPAQADLLALFRRVQRANPAPYAAFVRLPDHQVSVVSASPELFLRRDGSLLACAPIKGTGRHAGDIAAKDVAENVMIVDMVRNDLGRVCRPGTVEVRDFLELQPHPGLVQLVSTVQGQLRADSGWGEILAATFPAASITGAPRSTAMRAIAELEPVPRGVYCGTVGLVGPVPTQGSLSVAIRTFFVDDDDASAGTVVLRFGTGAGITWGSDPHREWAETELKARRLLSAAAGRD
jgi:para-aminobenzoate synthetase component 1